MKKHVLAGLLSLIAILLITAPVSAGRQWCAIDPIVELNGTELQVWVAIPAEFVPLVNGPVAVEFRTPAGVTRSVVLTDAGFNGFGEVVSFSDDPSRVVSASGVFRVDISTVVPIDTSLAGAPADPSLLPLQITIIENGRATTTPVLNNGRWVTTVVRGSN